MNLPVRTSLDAVAPESEAEGVWERTLGPWNLIALGIGAVIGAGIFTLSGVAAATRAGPAVIVSFLIAGAASAFAGLCYSEFASMIPRAGSAYTYAYATLGELAAWIIGWDLLLEYAVGAATVSIGWSRTLVSLLSQFHVSLPAALTSSPFESITLPGGEVIRGVVNLPASLIAVLASLLLIVGIKASARANAIIVVLKVSVLIVFICIGWGYMQPANHQPFIPPNTGEFGSFGWSGILSGAGMIFFAYIGFDAVSTAAQESRRPQRDMPIGIIGSLIVCTVLFVLYAYVLTGIVNYTKLNVGAPLSLALAKLPYPWLGALMNLAVLAGLTSVILVQLLGQSRILFAMSRDGLLPTSFAAMHPVFHTPWRCNLMLMLFVAAFGGLVPIGIVGALSSIGTLFAFAVVCLGILILRRTQPERKRGFSTPWVPLVPILGILCNAGLMASLGWRNWLRLFIWLLTGLGIYFSFGRKRSVAGRAASRLNS